MHLAENIIAFDHATFSLQSYSELSVDDFPYPIISDPNRDLAVQLGMLDPVEKDKAGLPLTCRAVGSPKPANISLPLPPSTQVFIVGPDKKLKLSILYPATTGRNFRYSPHTLYPVLYSCDCDYIFPVRF